MKTWSKLTIIIILLMILILTILGVIIGYGQYSNKGVELTFKNQSSQQIESLAMHLSGTLCGAKKLAPNGEVNCFFSGVGDSSYDVYITLLDGTELVKRNIGYVTGGINFVDTLKLNKTKEIQLESTIQ